MQQFKFEIGNICKTVGSAPTPTGDEPWHHRHDDEVRWLVVERMMQECHGGEQRHYHCRPVRRSGETGEKYLRFAEIELEKSGPFEIPVRPS